MAGHGNFTAGRSFLNECDKWRTTMLRKLSVSNSHPEATTHWVKRMGVAGFTFFFLKGMLWLLIPWLAHSTLF